VEGPVSAPPPEDERPCPSGRTAVFRGLGRNLESTWMASLSFLGALARKRLAQPGFQLTLRPSDEPFMLLQQGRNHGWSCSLRK